METLEKRKEEEEKKWWWWALFLGLDVYCYDSSEQEHSKMILILCLLNIVLKFEVLN
jgi:hypothetical protein